VSGEHVAFTGTAWLTRIKLARKVQLLGGSASQEGNVTTETTILVRGKSSAWFFGDYGTKEQRAAELIRAGQRISVVHDFEFQKLVEFGGRAKVLDRIAGQPAEWLSAPLKRQFMEVAKIKGPLDREHSAKGRVEQGFLRGLLFRDLKQSVCSLCARRFPVELLVAAHIKPRSECSRRERLDAPSIVFGVCVLGCDALYERGLIGVDDRGRIIFSLSNNSATLGKILRRYRGKICNAWNDDNAPYFEWHKTRRFQGLQEKKYKI
jgi:hypothetical protein